MWFILPSLYTLNSHMKTLLTGVFVSCILSLLSCTGKVGSTEEPIISQPVLDALIAEHPMFSGSVLVSQDGLVTAGAHVGFANRASGEDNNAETLHSVGSVGKMFTAVAVAQLVNAGKLTYESSISDLIPEFGDRIDSAVSVDHLLHHTSGMGRFPDVDDAVLDTLASSADHFALVLSGGVRSDGPGKFSYRNTNYQILGEIVERTSGQSYESYVRENITDTAGMTGPVFVRRDRAKDLPIAEQYIAMDFETWWNSEESIVANSVDEFVHTGPPSTPSAGGGSYATASDMIRFATALRDGTLLPLVSFEEMCDLTPVDAAKGRGYGRGCRVNVDAQGTRVGHTGSSAGLQARFFLYLELGVDVIVLSNHDEQAAPLFGKIDDLIRTNLRGSE
jgi:CubicO group peptidase (beta-lactamase class C family)